MQTLSLMIVFLIICYYRTVKNIFIPLRKFKTLKNVSKKYAAKELQLSFGTNISPFRTQNILLHTFRHLR